ncbi:MerR family transcriptional regulator [Sphingobium fluviale]|uniref:MerR family transcriptional regulator n=1 Tax=Sphingobium fluviale TaxID=2506423 RepID=A0A4Q1KG69_9SPHN|nr:helix-turn-helix domain-containing protein [Sphingobium fluviale]RXR25200.1 MerR family transcriptional regulator [Sphingobium fluviale]
MAEPGFAIGELSRRTGCHIETIRYYERCALIPAAARRGRYRHYSQADAERLRFVRRSRELGFSLEEIKALLGLDAAQPAACGEAHHIAKANLTAVRSKLADLKKMETVLAGAVADCESRAFSGCPILDALSGSTPITLEVKR